MNRDMETCPDLLRCGKKPAAGACFSLVDMDDFRGSAGRYSAFTVSVPA
jgi:hypothetical protein